MKNFNLAKPPHRGCYDITTSSLGTFVDKLVDGQVKCERGLRYFLVKLRVSDPSESIIAFILSIILELLFLNLKNCGVADF